MSLAQEIALRTDIRNIIPNPGPEIYPTPNSGTGVTTSVDTAVHWNLEISLHGTWSWGPDSDTPSGSDSKSAYSLKHNCTTADGTVNASDYTFISYRIEGFNWNKLHETGRIAVSFYIKSNKTGIYTAGIRAGDGSTTYLKEVTINSADTWERKSFVIDTVPTITSGFDATNSTGASFIFTMAAGTNWQESPNSWVTGNKLGTSNNVNGADSTSNYYSICQLQIEESSVVTPYRHLPGLQASALMERYYHVQSLSARGYATGGGQYYNTLCIYPTSMRATPTVNLLSAGTLSGNLASAATGNIITSSARFEILSNAAGDLYALGRTYEFDARL